MNPDQQRDDEATSRRTYRLWERRVSISQEVPALRQHTNILRQLGPKAMSDDEREERNGVVSYRIRVPQWRNIVLTHFLRTFDDIAAVWKNQGLRDRRGNPFRMRIYGGAESLEAPCQRATRELLRRPLDER